MAKRQSAAQKKWQACIRATAKANPGKKWGRGGLFRAAKASCSGRGKTAKRRTRRHKK